MKKYLVILSISLNIPLQGVFFRAASDVFRHKKRYCVMIACSVTSEDDANSKISKAKGGYLYSGQIKKPNDIWVEKYSSKQEAESRRNGIRSDNNDS